VNLDDETQKVEKVDNVMDGEGQHAEGVTVDRTVEKAAPSPLAQKRKLDETEAENRKSKRKKIDEPRTVHALPPKPSSATTVAQEAAQEGDDANVDDNEDDEAWQRQMAEEMAEELATAEEETAAIKLSVEEGTRILKVRSIRYSLCYL
jgi:hypothetical protein